MGAADMDSRFRGNDGGVSICKMARRAGALVRLTGGERPEGISRRRVSPTRREDAQRQRRTAPKTHGALSAPSVIPVRPLRHSRASGNPETVGIDSRLRGNDESVDFALLPPGRGEEYEWVSPWQEEEGACPCGSGGVAGVFRFAGWPAGGGARPARGRRTSRGDIPSVPSVIPAEAGIYSNSPWIPAFAGMTGKGGMTGLYGGDDRSMRRG